MIYVFPKRRGGNADASSGYPFSLNVKGLFGCISMCKRVPYFRIRENGGEANSRWRIKDAAGGRGLQGKSRECLHNNRRCVSQERTMGGAGVRAQRPCSAIILRALALCRLGKGPENLKLADYAVGCVQRALWVSHFPCACWFSRPVRARASACAQEPYPKGKVYAQLCRMM